MDVTDGRTSFDWSIILRVLLCLFLGGGVVLFIRNNRLLEHGFRVLANPEVLIMLALLGIPFVFALAHLIRSFSHHRSGEPQT